MRRILKADYQANMLSQIPGLTVAADQTEVLAMGYWPSYNVPFYPEIYRQAAPLAGFARPSHWHATNGSVSFARLLMAHHTQPQPPFSRC